MKFELNNFNRNISEEELINDLNRVNSLLLAKGETLTFRSYKEYGKVTSGTIQTRFSTWNKALNRAGIKPTEEKNIEDIDLFRNLENVWIYKRSQPVSRDMSNKPSKYTAGTYSQRFGTWRKALEVFVDYINNTDIDNLKINDIEDVKVTSKETIHKRKKRTSRNISDRMRFRILMRDGFSCKSCGASPTKTLGLELHVDHIIPWSKGGETEENNLETKCIQCNLGKGNAFNK